MPKINFGHVVGRAEAADRLIQRLEFERVHCDRSLRLQLGRSRVSALDHANLGIFVTGYSHHQHGGQKGDQESSADLLHFADSVLAGGTFHWPGTAWSACSGRRKPVPIQPNTLFEDIYKKFVSKTSAKPYLRGRIPHAPNSASGFHIERRIVLSGDIEANPGPKAKRVPKFPCKKCERGIKNNLDAILCIECNTWSHVNCIGMSKPMFQYYLNHPDIDWTCDCCSLHGFTEFFSRKRLKFMWMLRLNVNTQRTPQFRKQRRSLSQFLIHMKARITGLRLT